VAKIGSVTLAVGDYVRRSSDDWEGRVTATTDKEVTLRMNSGDVWTGPADACRLNAWDPRRPQPATPPR
jgi:hypothetical protein